MTIYKNQVINPEKPWSFMDDTKENILKDLAEYILDPVFEEYGNFVYMPLHGVMKKQRKSIKD